MGQKNVLRACVLLLVSCLLIVVAAWSEIRPFIEALSGSGPSFVEPLSTSLTFANGGDGIGLAKGDFNADGKLDVAVTHTVNVPNVGSRGFVSVLLGNGDGTFQAPNTMPVPDANAIVGFAYGILAKDFDADNKTDLVVAVGEQRRVLFFKGHGDGAFDSPIGFGTVDRCVGLQAAYLNGDGFLDLVTLNTLSGDHSVSVLPGHGDGTFGPATTYATNVNPNSVALADVDGVNGNDIVIGCYGDGNNQPSIDVLLNNASGVFPSSATRFNQQLQVLGLYAADFDGDTKVDLVATGYGGPTSRSLMFIKGAGNGTFSAPPDQNFQAIEDNPVGSTRFSENTLTDLNGDGRLDLLINHGGAFNIVTVALGRGDGHFDIQELVASNGPGFLLDSQGHTPPADGNGTNAAIPGDFNGDGVPDLVVGSFSGGDRAGGVSLILGAGQGKFLAPRGAAVRPNSGYYYAGNTDRSTALGDFNGDGKLDLITLLSGPGTLAEVLPGNGDGTFGASIAALGLTSGYDSAGALRIADMNRDGKLDVIVTSWPAGVQGNSGTNATRIAYGLGNGTFSYAVTLLPGDPTWVMPNVVVGDFNKDGAPDLAVLTIRYGDCCGGAINHIDVFIQSPTQAGTFTRTATYPETDLGDIHSSGIAIADLDGDGNPDLIAQGTSGVTADQVFFLKGKGDGTFQAPVVLGPVILYGNRTGEFRSLDLNHDAKPDLVVTGYGGISVYLNNGNGTVQPPVSYASGGGSVSSIDIADLDVDGNVDVAIASDRGFTTLRGAGDGTFQAPVYWGMGYLGAQNVRAGDLNGDGKPDAVVGHGLYTPERIGFTPLLLVKPPDLVIRKMHSGNFVVGSNGVYILTVNNTGTLSSSGTITVADTLPAGLTFVSGTGTGWNCSAAAQVVTCTNPGPIAGGAGTTITLTAAVGLAAFPGVTNTATVSNASDTNTDNNSSANPTTVVKPPDLVMNKAHSGNFVVGTNGVYTLTVSNAGTLASSGTVTVADTLPAGLSFVSGTGTGWSCSAVAQVVTCTNPGPIAGGASTSITLTVAVALAAFPGVTNTATVSNASDTNPANNSSANPTTVVKPPDLVMNKTHSGNFSVGTNGVYTLTTSNSGTLASSGTITVADTLPAGLSFVSGTGTGWSCSVAAQVVTCTNPGPIAGGAGTSITLTVAVALAAFPGVTNTATVSNTSDTNPANNSSANPTTVLKPTDLAMNKTHSGNFAVGINGVYTLTVSNAGTLASSGTITVADTLPTGLSFVSATGTGWSCAAAAQVVTCTNPGPIAGGASSSITLSVAVGSAAFPDVTNTATVSNASDTNPANNSSANPTTVARRPHHTTGVFRPSSGALYLKAANASGFADAFLTYGLPGDYPLTGDWDGDGADSIGIYRNGTFYLRNSNTNGFADLVFAFGAPGDQPVVGDWDGDGITTIGVYRNGTFFLRNSNTSGPPDIVFTLGIPGDIGIAGDWDGNGTITTGVFRPSTGALFLKNSNTSGVADLVLTYGLPGDLPVIGDWDGDGTDTIGVYRQGTFYLRNSNTVGFADIVFALGVPGDHPIAGRWRLPGLLSLETADARR